jgi:hypothetical protein
VSSANEPLNIVRVNVLNGFALANESVPAVKKSSGLPVRLAVTAVLPDGELKSSVPSNACAANGKVTLFSTSLNVTVSD